MSVACTIVVDLFFSKMWSLSSSVCNQQRNLGVIARMIATPMNREHTGRRQTNRQASELLVGQFSPLLCSGQSVLLTVITFINKVNYHLSFLAFYLIKQVFDRWTDMTLLPSRLSWVKKKTKCTEWIFCRSVFGETLGLFCICVCSCSKCNIHNHPLSQVNPLLKVPPKCQNVREHLTVAWELHFTKWSAPQVPVSLWCQFSYVVTWNSLKLLA